MIYRRFLIFLTILCCICQSLLGDIPLHQQSALNIPIDGPAALTLDTQDHLFVVEQHEYRVLRIDLKTKRISTVAGAKPSPECVPKNKVPAKKTCLYYPTSLSVGSNGDLFIGDLNGYVRRVDVHTGIITTIHSKSSISSQIYGLAVDKNDNLFIADVRQIFELNNKDGRVKLIAGQPKYGFSGDGNAAHNAQFSFISFAVDRDNNIAIADHDNCRIRYIENASGIVNTIAATESVQNCSTGGSAVREPCPSDPVFDSHGNIYFIEGAMDLVLRVDAKTHAISSVAGNGKRGFGGDGGLATKAMLSNPSGLAIDGDGNLYISEYVNNRIRRVDAKTGIITTIAGNGLPHRMDLSE